VHPIHPHSPPTHWARRESIMACQKCSALRGFIELMCIISAYRQHVCMCSFSRFSHTLLLATPAYC
jgi:hypothetical protein